MRAWRAEQAAWIAAVSRHTVQPSWPEAAMPARHSMLSFTALLSMEGSALICEPSPISDPVIPPLLTTCNGKFCLRIRA